MNARASSIKRVLPALLYLIVAPAWNRFAPTPAAPGCPPPNPHIEPGVKI